MNDDCDSPAKLCFGAFQVDLRSGELSKNGSRIKLQEQPFQILARLLHRPGAVVTREELRQALWPSGIHVDFENGLNIAIKKLRQALADDADVPRFIETLPRCGYRFIAPVATEALALSGGETARPPARDTAEPVPEKPRRITRIAISLAALAVVAVVVAIAIWWRSAFDARAPQPIRSIAVLPLQNLSGDPAQDYFADGMTEQLISDLAQIRALRVISRTSSMAYKQTRKTVPVIGRELNVDAVVEGAVVRSGGRVRITAQLIEAADNILGSGSSPTQSK